MLFSFQSWYCGWIATTLIYPDIILKCHTISLSHGRFSAILGVLPLPLLRVSAPRNTTLYYCSCLYNGKFTVTTFKSPFSCCLNCLESFTRADSTPKMADFGLREKDYFTLLHILCIASLILKTINAGAIVALLDVQKAPKRDWSGLFNLAYNHRYFKHLAFQIIFTILIIFI